MNARAWTLATIGGTLLLAMVPTASAMTIRADRTQTQYLSLGASSALASVGQFVGSTDSSGFYASGTLISSNWVLTAAHVVEDATSLTFNVGGSSYTAKSWVAYSGWTGDLWAGYDIALVQLDTSVNNVTAAKRYYGSSEYGATAITAGYGMTGTGVTGATGFDSQKRAGTNTIDYFANSRLFLTDFDNPTSRQDNVTGSSAATVLEMATAPGDSGGGLFVTDRYGNYLLAGVVSFGASLDGSTDSDYGDLSGYTRVSAFNSWIDSVLGVTTRSTVRTHSGQPSDGRTGGRRYDLETTDIPEPSSVAFLALAGGMAIAGRRGGPSLA